MAKSDQYTQRVQHKAEELAAPKAPMPAAPSIKCNPPAKKSCPDSEDDEDDIYGDDDNNEEDDEHDSCGDNETNMEDDSDYDHASDDTDTDDNLNEGPTMPVVKSTRKMAEPAKASEMVKGARKVVKEKVAPAKVVMPPRPKCATSKCSEDQIKERPCARINNQERDCQPTAPMTSKRVRKDYKEEEEGDEQGINEGQHTLPPPTKKAKKGEKQVRVDSPKQPSPAPRSSSLPRCNRCKKDKRRECKALECKQMKKELEEIKEGQQNHREALQHETLGKEKQGGTQKKQGVTQGKQRVKPHKRFLSRLVVVSDEDDDDEELSPHAKSQKTVKRELDNNDKIDDEDEALPSPRSILPGPKKAKTAMKGGCDNKRKSPAGDEENEEEDQQLPLKKAKRGTEGVPREDPERASPGPSSTLAPCDRCKDQGTQSECVTEGRKSGRKSKTCTLCFIARKRCARNGVAQRIHRKMMGAPQTPAPIPAGAASSAQTRIFAIALPPTTAPFLPPATAPHAPSAPFAGPSTILANLPNRVGFLETRVFYLENELERMSAEIRRLI
ncbi:hypothetical protein BJ912DRAFT_987499 [Pholiota molesta]|nr:hypothetical protein BJ912DRAFT_987499 [Pholiota molesta]